jgi:hypothetical protein
MLRILNKTDLPIHRENHSGEMFIALSVPPQEAP